MLPADHWRALLHDAGFDVGLRGIEDSSGGARRGGGGGGGGVVRERVVETRYANAHGAYERLAAAWGPMFPTLPTTPLRSAFFADVAATAAHLGGRRGHGDGEDDNEGIVVRNLVVDIAVSAYSK